MQVVGVISAELGVELRAAWRHQPRVPWLRTAVVFSTSVMSLKKLQRQELSLRGSEIGNTASGPEDSDPLQISL